MGRGSKKKKKVGKSRQTLDLHGYRVSDVADAVDAFLMKWSKKASVCILPGKGSGKVRSEVIRYLDLGGFPWSYETTGDGKANQGSIIVFLD